MHICNDVGGWGSGFVSAADKLLAVPKAVYWQQFKLSASLLELGTVQLMNEKLNARVDNLIGQHLHKFEKGDQPIWYNKAVCLGLMRHAKQVMLFVGRIPVSGVQDSLLGLLTTQ